MFGALSPNLSVIISSSSPLLSRLMGSGILKANVGDSIRQKQEKKHVHCRFLFNKSFLGPDYKYLSTKLCIQGYDRNDVEFSL